jgi:hypothetical protein
MKALSGSITLTILGLFSAAPVLAADKDAMPGMNMPGMKMSNMASEQGAHAMGGSVTSVDHATGLIDVISDGIKMRLHFPPDTIKDLKRGDKITLHLGFTKP